jgi:membrane protein YdbS with pleckstrin-like domain
LRIAEVACPAGAVSWLAFSVSVVGFFIIMGQLKHTSEKATPYRTDEMQVKNGVFDREKTLVKTG